MPDTPTTPAASDEPVEPVAGEEVVPAESEAPVAEEAEAIIELPANIDTIDEDELYSLHEQLTEQLATRRESARTPDDVGAVRSVTERMNAISGELERRRAEAQQVADELAALDESLPQALPERQPEPALAGAGASAAQVAAARTAQANGAQSPPPPMPARPRVAMVAAAGAEIVPAGNEISYDEIGVAFDRIKGQPGGQTILASLPGYETSTGMPEPLSRDNGASRNRLLIDEAVEDWQARQPWFEGAAPARTAAICEPFDIIRDIPSAFSTSEPARGIFPSRPASRLGYQFMQGIDLATVLSGVALWSDADQAAVDDSDSTTWKPCVEVTCGEMEDIKAEPVTACLSYEITTEMSSPERVKNFMEALMALKARVKEGRILQRVDQLSVNWSYLAPNYGSVPTIIEALNTALAQLTFGNRMEDTNYVLLVPPGITQLGTIDRANRGFAQDTTDDVMAYIKANVDGVSNVVNTLDSSRGGEPGIPFVALPAVNEAVTPIGMPYLNGTYRFRLVEPAAAIYSETGEINVGVNRDARLIRQNRTEFFTEEFFFLAKHGVHPWVTVDIKLCPDGSRAGLVDPDGCLVS